METEKVRENMATEKARKINAQKALKGTLKHGKHNVNSRSKCVITIK